MSIYDKRLDTLEKDVAVMKQDIIYKLDDTNSAVTIIKGVTGVVSQDVKLIRSQSKTMESQIKTLDIRLEGIDARLARVEEQQHEQGQDIRDIKRRLDAMDQEVKQGFSEIKSMLSKLTPGSET